MSEGLTSAGLVVADLASMSPTEYNTQQRGVLMLNKSNPILIGGGVAE